MARTVALAVLMIGCSGAEPATDVAPGAGPPGAPAAVAISLDEEPPALGPASQALQLVADAYGVGMVRCPIGGAGTVMSVWGSQRDLAKDLGAGLRLHMDPLADAPWPSLYDVGFVEAGGWLTMLAKPGSTSGYVRSVSDTKKLTWQPGVKGEIVRCTAVVEVPARAVTGVVPQSVGLTRGFIYGCGLDRKLLEGGEFAGDARVPCTVAAHGTNGTAGKAQRIEPSTEALHIEINLEPDPDRNPDGKFSSDGLDRLKEVAEVEVVALEEQLAVLDGLLESHDAKSPVGRSLGRWRLDRQALLDETRVTIELLGDPVTRAKAASDVGVPAEPGDAGAKH